MDLAPLTDRLVRDFVRYDGGPLVVLADSASWDIAEAIGDSARATPTTVGVDYTLLNVEVWADSGALNLQPSHIAELDELLNGPDMHHNTTLYIGSVLPVGARKDINRVASKKGKIGGLPFCTIDVLAHAYHPSNNLSFPDELEAFLQETSEIRITSPDGTNLLVHNNVRAPGSQEGYVVAKSNGILKPGIYANPIPAEVFFHPESVDGQLVITGSYGELMSQQKFRGNYETLAATLQEKPIVWQISEGRITDVTCDDTDIETFVRYYVFEQDPHGNGDRIGEIGCPANLFVLNSELTGNLLIDEKGRAHCANGSGYNDRTGCTYESDVHSDGLINKATLQSLNTGKIFMKDDRYNPEMFPSLR